MKTINPSFLAIVLLAMITSLGAMEGDLVAPKIETKSQKEIPSLLLLAADEFLKDFNEKNDLSFLDIASLFFDALNGTGDSNSKSLIKTLDWGKDNYNLVMVLTLAMLKHKIEIDKLDIAKLNYNNLPHDVFKFIFKDLKINWEEWKKVEISLEDIAKIQNYSMEEIKKHFESHWKTLSYLDKINEEKHCVFFKNDFCISVDLSEHNFLTLPTQVVKKIKNMNGYPLCLNLKYNPIMTSKKSVLELRHQLSFVHIAELKPLSRKEQRSIRNKEMPSQKNDKIDLRPWVINCLGWCYGDKILIFLMKTKHGISGCFDRVIYGCKFAWEDFLIDYENYKRANANR